MPPRIVPLRTAALLALAGWLLDPRPAPAEPLDLAGHGVVDLTHVYDGDTVYWPTAPSRFELFRLAFGVTEGGWFYAANRFCTPEHGGTHLDAPIHFAEGRHSVEEIPLERLMGPAVVIDIGTRATSDPDAVLTAQDVAAFEAAHGRIAAGTIVLLRTGWSRFWPDAHRYLGDATPGDASKLRFPSFGAEAARLLVEERRVSALGVDTASIDPGRSRDFPVHRISAAAQVPGLENLANLDRLPPRGATVVALPMKIRGGSGAPVRAIAFLPD